MLCSTCCRSFDGYAKFCSGCGQPLVPPTRVQGTLTRPHFGKMIAGVCAGFAQAYGWDVALVRILVCTAALCGAGTVIIAYVIAWVVMPAETFVFPPQATGMTQQV